MTTKTLKFECPKLSGSLLVSPYAVHIAPHMKVSK